MRVPEEHWALPEGRRFKSDPRNQSKQGVSESDFASPFVIFRVFPGWVVNPTVAGAESSFSKLGRAGTVVEVDINAGMLATARKISPAIDWRGEGNATGLATYNVVVCRQGLQFFPNRAAVLRETHRTLMPRGRLAIACWKGIQHSSGFSRSPRPRPEKRPSVAVSARFVPSSNLSRFVSRLRLA